MTTIYSTRKPETVAASDLAVGDRVKIKGAARVVTGVELSTYQDRAAVIVDLDAPLDNGARWFMPFADERFERATLATSW